METRKIVAIAVAASLTAALIAGCAKGMSDAEASRTEDKSGVAATLQGIGSAPATLAVSEPMRPFFAAGLGFIVLGGLAACFGGKGTGFAMMGLGVATTATGVLFVQYPWIVLVLALLAGLVALLAVIDGFRTGRVLERSQATLEAAAEVIQNTPEGAAIKAGLANLGAEMEARIRSVIDPIKQKLRQEGRIADAPRE